MGREADLEGNLEEKSKSLFLFFDFLYQSNPDHKDQSRPGKQTLDLNDVIWRVRSFGCTMGDERGRWLLIQQQAATTNKKQQQAQAQPIHTLKQADLTI